MNLIIRDGLVCRDIAGVFFIIDIYDKHCYRNKQLNCVNRTAYIMISAMIERKSFTIDDILGDILPLFAASDEVTEQRIRRDVSSLTEVMSQKGWLTYAE